jgi:TolB-like protein/Tfp pilus assembly protein PilF
MTIRFVFADFELIAQQQLLLHHGKPVTLGARAFDVLLCLLQSGGDVVSKADLMKKVWPGTVVEETNLTVQISSLRKLLGPQSIATIAGRGYRFTMAAVSGPDVQPTGDMVSVLDVSDEAVATPPKVDKSFTEVSDKPSLAVLPFINRSGDLSQEYFVDGMVDDLTNALSRVQAFFVIARSSSFTYKGRNIDVQQVGRELGVRYVLEGSLQRAGDRLRIAVQLVQTLTGHQVWSRRFDGWMENVFDLQDQITSQVVAAMEPQLRLAELNRTRYLPTANLQAYDLCLRSLPLLFQSTTEEKVNQGMEYLRQALQSDPDYSYAKGLLALSACMAWSNRWMSGKQVREYAHFAQEAITDHRYDPLTLAYAGHGVLVIAGKHELAMHAVNLALKINPNLHAVQTVAGWVNTYNGRAETALGHFDSAEQLNPLAPELGYTLSGKAYAFLHLQRYPEAVAVARRSLLEFPDFIPTKVGLMHALVRNGNLTEARQLKNELCQKIHNFTVSRYQATQHFTHADYIQRCVEDLQVLGFPD